MDKENEEWKPKTAEERRKEAMDKCAGWLFENDNLTMDFSKFVCGVRANIIKLWKENERLTNKVEELEKEIISLKVG